MSSGAEPALAAGTYSQWGDARTGKLADNLTGFCRALRRAGLRIDSGQIALAHEAAMLVGLAHKSDFAAALEAVLVRQEADRAILRELFEVYFRDPQVANKLLAQMLPRGEGQAEPVKRRPRVQDALAAVRAAQTAPQPHTEREFELDAAMTASDQRALRQADFNGLSTAEYQLVEKLVRQMRMAAPQVVSRRTTVGAHGSRLHWPALVQRAARDGGDCLRLPRLTRRTQPLPLLILVDVSGSMERYARLLLAFLHMALLDRGRRDVFAFGTQLTDLSIAFRQRDTDTMLSQAARAIDDFAGGTRLGECLGELRRQHARRLVGRRTLVLLISDGLDTGEPALLDRELAWLGRHSRQLLWLNPLMRFDRYAPSAQGAAVLHRHAHRMLAVHNLTHLQQLADSLSDVLRQ
jgi:uncharacterized protein